MSSGTTAQGGPLKTKEHAEEARYIHEKEQAQLAAMREETKNSKKDDDSQAPSQPERDFEGGFGGQEDLEDRYATTSGEH